MTRLLMCTKFVARESSRKVTVVGGMLHLGMLWQLCTYHELELNSCEQLHICTQLGEGLVNGKLLNTSKTTPDMYPVH